MWNKHLAVAIGIAVLSLFVFWMPFGLRLKNVGGIEFNQVGMERVIQNFDGLNFLVVAKSWYQPDLISHDYQEILSGRRPLYFSAHYPGLPMMIALFDTVTTGPNAVLLSIVASNILLAIALFWFFRTITNNDSTSVLLTTISLFFPARMLAVRTVGSNEPLFMFFVLTSLILSVKGKHWGSAILGSLAVLTRSPGILLFGAYFLAHFWIYRKSLGQMTKVLLPYFLIPGTLVGLFLFYGMRFSSFFAYFQVGGNINLSFPFAVFSSSQPWVSGMWLEDIIYLFLLLMIGIKLFWDKNKTSPIAIFGLIYLAFIVCVAHRDLSRYSLPIWPIAIVGFTPYLASKTAKIIMIIMIVPIFLFAWQFVLTNYQPVSNWTPFL